jgi:hypothetical protein
MYLHKLMNTRWPEMSGAGGLSQAKRSDDSKPQQHKLMEAPRACARADDRAHAHAREEVHMDHSLCDDTGLSQAPRRAPSAHGAATHRLTEEGWVPIGPDGASAAERGGGKAMAIETAAPSAQHQPNPLDVAIGLGLGACLTLSTALALEHSWLGAGTFTLVLACILACLHQDSRA